jgi:hypothetical protein
VWFKHRAWIPIAGFLSVANIVAVWFAAQPAEPWHATTHGLLAVLFGVGAQRLAARHQGSRYDDIIALREELAALRQGQSEVLSRVERGVDAIAIEMERIGESQRFLTKTLSDPARKPALPT